MKKFTTFEINKNIKSEDVLKLLFSETNIFKEIEDDKTLFTDGFCKFNETQDYLLVQNVLAVKYKKVEKVIPKAYVKEKVNEIVCKIKKEEVRSVSKKEIKEIKEKILEEIIPRAFTKTTYIDVYFDFNKGLMYIESTSDKLLDSIVIKVIDNELNLAPQLLTSENGFSEKIKDKILNNWFEEDENQYGIILNDSCTIEFSGFDKTPKIKVSNLNINSEDVINAINKENRFITSLKLILEEGGEEICFNIDEKLRVYNIKNNLLKRKFDPMENTIENFNLENLIIEINSINTIINAIKSLTD